MIRLTIVASLAIAAVLAVSAARIDTGGTVVLRHEGSTERVAFEAPMPVEPTEPELPPLAAAVPVLTPTPAVDTAGSVDIGHRAPVDCQWMPEQTGC